MRVLIDLTPLYGRKATGVEMYAIDLYKALMKTANDIVPVFHVRNTVDGNSNAIIIPQKNRLVLENIYLTKVVKTSEADVAIFPIFPPPVNVYGGNTKIVPVLHDLAYLKFRNTLNTAAKYYLTPKMNRALKKADSIITISETVKQEASKITLLPIFNCGENISIEYKNALKKVNPALLKEWNLEPNKYVISVSTIEPRKNFKYLLTVVRPFLQQNNMKLVLVGRKGWGSDIELQQLIRDMGDLLIFTDYVKFESLVTLYNKAYSFFLLSIDEGFGRTPFEALACGCKRIVLSDIPIFRETFGNKATFLPLENIEECKRLLAENSIAEVNGDIEIPYDVVEQKLPDVIYKLSTL